MHTEYKLYSENISQQLQREIDCLMGLEVNMCVSVFDQTYCLYNVIHCLYTTATYLQHVIQCPMRLAT